MNDTANRRRNGHPGGPPEVSDEELAEIRALLKGLRYGSVQIIVQDGVIVQIDRTEKRRIVGPKSNKSPTAR